MKPGQILKTCDELIRRGRIFQARRLFARIEFKKLTRAETLSAANVARRVSKIDLGLKLLYPFVYPEHAGVSPREAERAEYATLLSLAGCVREALDLLPTPKSPESLLARAWCLFETWNYEDALALLRSYIKEQKDPYYVFAGRVNLAEALYSTGDSKESLEHLSAAISFAESAGYDRLLANALHLRARSLAELGQFKKSDADLAHAASIFGTSPTADAFLIGRQRVFNRARKTKDLRPLRRLRVEATRGKHWESVREIDFQSLSIEFHEKVFEKLYFGTPHEDYRARLVNAFARKAPESFIWGRSRALGLDLESGWLSGGELTKQLHRLLAQLASDLYAPQSLGQVFSGVFPGERFHWQHSPNRVHQVLNRLRRFFKEQRIPLDVACVDSFYSLRMTGPFAIRIPRSVSLDRDPLAQLRAKFNSAFTAGDARLLLKMPKSSLTRLLRDAVESGELEVIGVGRGTRYRVSGTLKK